MRRYREFAPGDAIFTGAENTNVRRDNTRYSLHPDAYLQELARIAERMPKTFKPTNPRKK